MLLATPTTRRKFLLSSLLALPTLGIGVKLLTAAQAAELAAPDLDAYTPEFFSAQEWKFVLAVCDRIIPAGGSGPGALETNVPIFIDQQLHSGGLGDDVYMQGPFNTEAPATLGFQIPYTPQQIYQRSIKATNAWCQQTQHRDFCDLDSAGQDQVLKALQANTADFSAFGEAILKPATFLSEVMADSKNGYLSDPMYGGNKGMKAWIAIGFPGARASFLEWVTQHNVKYPLGPVSVGGQRA